ncbi:MAG: hypothetical protein KDA84_18625 [Planctomycetaceae bacterium]|nr:hypothetical protein [Planctomycetaceae bacterium]
MSRKMENAIWFPCWYELDQSIEVDHVNDFDFFVNTPDELKDGDRLVFYCGSWREGASFTRRAKVLSIQNKHFGAVRKIDTVGLDYTIVFPDGREQKIEAEESPGLVYDWPEPISDWRFYVGLEFVD